MGVRKSSKRAVTGIEARGHKRSSRANFKDALRYGLSTAPFVLGSLIWSSGAVAQTAGAATPTPNAVAPVSGERSKVIVREVVAPSRPKGSVHADAARVAGEHTALKVKSVPPSPAPGAVTLTVAPDSAARAAAINATLGYRGWNVAWPSFADTLSQDAGGYRSTLALYGFGFLTYNIAIAGDNLLNTPRTVPSNFPVKCPAEANELGKLCAGNRAYYGQRPDYDESETFALTYDTSRWGVPDGLLTMEFVVSVGSDQAYIPNDDGRLLVASWYQTAFDRRAELEFGYLQGSQEFIGQTVGGNFANPFGPSAGVPALLGLSGKDASTPMARATIPITGDFKNGLYDEVAVARSIPVRGFFPGGFQNEHNDNPSGFDFFSSEPGTGAVFIDEFGYRQQSKPGQLYEWFRAGTIYNNSTFSDLSRVAMTPTATVDGSGASAYVLADQQITQPDQMQPGRGIYVGGTFMYASPTIASFTQYDEGRIYWKGPLDSRPNDMFSFVYARNEVSKYLAATPVNALTGVAFAQSTNTYTISYTLRATAGVYVTLGLSYVDHPSVQFFQGEGGALLLQAATIIAF
jgi:porin